MKQIKFYALLILFGIIYASAAVASPCMQSAYFKDCKVGEPWTIRAEGSYNFGQFIGIEESYAELDLFIAPKHTGRAQNFIDFRGYLLENGRGGGSVGIGRRLWEPDRCRALGANLYYDYYRGKFGAFNRIGLGLEYLGECLDFRANAYFPLNHASRQKGLHVFTAFIGPFFETCQEREFSFFGIDGEIGTSLWNDCFFDFYAAIGPYFYHHDQLKQIYGGYARLNLAMGEWIRLEAKVSSDSFYRTKYQGSVIISLPLYTLFNPTCESNLCRDLLTQPVQRTGLMFTHSCCDRTFNWEQLLENIEEAEEGF